MHVDFALLRTLVLTLTAALALASGCSSFSTKERGTAVPNREPSSIVCREGEVLVPRLQVVVNFRCLTKFAFLDNENTFPGPALLETGYRLHCTRLPDDRYGAGIYRACVKSTGNGYIITNLSHPGAE